MERLERTVVQLWEARRLAEHADVPHGRLALLLLDNAAETLLARNAATALVWSDHYGRLLRRLAHVASDDSEGQRLRQSFADKVVPKKERRRIERSFDALVDYVFAQDGCGPDPALGDCLKILHQYRNAAYHHDTVRPDVLGPAVEVYLYLCCMLLKDQRAIAQQIALPPASVVEVVEALGGQLLVTHWPAGATTSSALGVVVADLLLADRQLDHGHIGGRLAEHLAGRLRALAADLDHIREYMTPDDRGHPAIRAAAAPRLSRCHGPPSQGFLDAAARRNRGSALQLGQGQRGHSHDDPGPRGSPGLRGNRRRVSRTRGTRGAGHVGD